MSLILAVEPDRRQAAHLTHIVRQKVGVELILAETTELALAQIGNRVPDLILVPALLSPTDDAALAAALRVIATAAHVQMLTTPLFPSAAPAERARGILSAFRRAKPSKPATDGCDPAEFATQISSYLEAAAEQRAAAQFIEPPLPVMVPAAAPPPVAATTAHQRYVPLEPGRRYSDEATTSHEFAALPAATSEQTPAWTEAEPVPEMAEPLGVALEAEQVPASDTSEVETLLEPMATFPEPMSEIADPMLETAEPLYAAPEPIFETPEPVYEAPTPTYEAPEPILEAPVPVLDTPEPIFETPEPVYEPPTPTYEEPEPIYAASEPTFERSWPNYETSAPIYEAPEATPQAEAPVLETPEPILEAAEPTIEAPEPILETPAPALEMSEPNFEALEPILEAPEPIFEAPDPIFETPEPVFETPRPPEPLAPRGPAYSRRIGFVVRDEEPELAPLAADSLDIEFEPIELAAIDSDFVLDGLSEPATTFSAADDEAIELVDVDLSTALSEFNEPHVIEAQSDADVVELFDTETPALVEGTPAGTTAVRAIEFDALKEFAAAIEAMTASEQTVSMAHHSGPDAEPFEFDDLFPSREPVEPSPLGAWRSWMPLEGIAAEALEVPVPARVVEQSAENQQAPERPEWVQLVESLRIDVERRRSEQPAAATPAPARKPSTRPIQDEWGLFDPAQCGFAALLDKLEEITETNSSRPRRSA